LAAGVEGAHAAASPDRDEARIGVHLHGFGLIGGRSVAEAAGTVLNWGAEPAPGRDLVMPRAARTQGIGDK
jgi:hypothetical protein